MPLAAGAASILVNVLLCMALAQRMGVAGLASPPLYPPPSTPCCWTSPWSCGGGVLSRSFLLDLGKMALATALMAVGAWAVAGLTEGLLPGKAGGAAHPGGFGGGWRGRLLPGGGAAEIGRGAAGPEDGETSVETRLMQ